MSYPRVALLIESSRAYGRGLLRGIASYVRQQGRWSIYVHERSLAERLPPWFAGWKGDGIIARIETEAMWNAIRRLKVPAVDLRGVFAADEIPVINTNDREVAIMAVDHLRERGFSNFAYCGFPGANWSESRHQFVASYLAELDLELSSYHGHRCRGVATATVEADGILHEQQLGEWLRSLPRPCGVIACNDVRAQQILNVCRMYNISVPGELAVIGVDNDDIICDLSDPPLSSVAIDSEGIGYRAAALLDEMMSRSPPPKSPILVSPTGVVARQSTDASAVPDRDVRRAMRLIRERACDGLSVFELVRELPVSRSTLERKFSLFLDTTPKVEINRIRLQRAMQLLTETNFKLPVIARMTGFSHAEYLSAVFKAQVGMTPGQYRKLHRRRHIVSTQDFEG
jgi:LacI family transcriptional regulator